MFRRRALCLVVLMVCMIAGVSSRPRAQDGQPKRTTLDLAGLGVNVPDQIINPDQDDRGLAGMQEQASRLLHDAHMMGAKTVRWFVTAVWSQYPCGRDPEDQATGALYPAWYKITRALLEAAEVEHIAVVIVMADTSNGKFIDHTHDQESRDRLLAGWSKYQSPSGCAVSFQNGYYGASAPPRFFEDPTIVHHLGARFVTMAKYLVGFPSLGGLEMFNEPEFDEVHRVQFATTVRALRERIRHEVPATAALPIYSGVASWDTKIAASLRQAGDLVDEPYITQHWYGDYSGQSAERLQANIDWIRTFIPDRRLIIAEAGSSVTIKNPAVHATMVSSLMSTMKNAHVGVWPWGTYFDPSSTAPDYKWEFNTRGLGGEAFRGFLIDTSREAAFAHATQVSFEHGAEPFRIQQVGRTRRRLAPVCAGGFRSDRTRFCP